MTSDREPLAGDGLYGDLPIELDFWAMRVRHIPEVSSEISLRTIEPRRWEDDGGK